MVRHGHGFGITLGLIVDTARTDRIDMARICFRLRRHFWVTVAFARGSEEEFGVLGESEAECVVSTERTHFQGLNGHFQVIDGAGRRSKVQDVINGSGNIDVIGDVSSRDAEAGMFLKVRYVRVYAGN